MNVVLSDWLEFGFPGFVGKLSWSALADLKINFFNGGEKMLVEVEFVGVVSFSIVEKEELTSAL